MFNSSGINTRVSRFVVIATFAARRTNGREPLIDYSQSHVVTSKKYLRIMRQKAMDSEVEKTSQESKKKEDKKGSKKNIYNVDCS
jgi:hypothetical protein